MTSVPARESPLSRSDLRDELDRTVKHYGTKADVADLKVWLVGLLLVVVLSVVGTVGAVVAALLARYGLAPDYGSNDRESPRYPETWRAAFENSIALSAERLARTSAPGQSSRQLR